MIGWFIRLMFAVGASIFLAFLAFYVGLALSATVAQPHGGGSRTALLETFLGMLVIGNFGLIIAASASNSSAADLLQIFGVPMLASAATFCVVLVGMYREVVRRHE